MPAIFHGLVNWHGTSAGTDDQFMVEYRPKVFDQTKKTMLSQIPTQVSGALHQRYVKQIDIDWRTYIFSVKTISFWVEAG